MPAISSLRCRGKIVVDLQQMAHCLFRSTELSHPEDSVALRVLTIEGWNGFRGDCEFVRLRLNTCLFTLPRRQRQGSPIMSAHPFLRMMLVLHACLSSAICLGQSSEASTALSHGLGDRIGPAEPLPHAEVLATRISIDAQNARLSELAASLNEQVEGVSITLDEPSLDAIGLSGELRVTLQLKDVTLGSALSILCRSLDLTMQRDSDSLRISTFETAESSQRVRLYRVGNFRPQAWSELIQTSIEPDTWSALGGAATISSFGNILVIKASDSTHEKVECLMENIERLREHRQQGHALPVALSVNRDSKSGAKIRKTLKKEVSVTMKNNVISLTDFAQQLAAQTGLNILIDTRALDDLGMTSDVKVSGGSAKQTLEDWLTSSLRRLDLTYYIDNEVIVVTTLDAAEMNLSLKLYPVEDLVRDLPHAPAWPLSTNVFVEPSHAMFERDRFVVLEGLPPAMADASLDQLIGVIQDSIVPDTWETFGGPSTLASMNGLDCLFVSTTEPVHRQIEHLLQTIGKAKRDEVGKSPTLDELSNSMVTVAFYPRLYTVDVDSIASVVRELIDPESWDDEDAVIEVLASPTQGSMIVIKQRLETIQRIAAYLMRLQ